MPWASAAMERRRTSEEVLARRGACVASWLSHCRSAARKRRSVASAARDYVSRYHAESRHPFRSQQCARSAKNTCRKRMGPGVAFIDYDNDGWQDIFLVNGMDWPGHAAKHSTPKLYHNNHDGTFTDVTHKAGLDVGTVRHGRGRRRLRQRRLRRSVRHRHGPEPSLPQQRQRNVHRRHPESRPAGPEGIQHQRRMGGLRQGRQARSGGRELCAVVARRRSLLHARWQKQIVLHAGILQRHLGAAVAQPRRRHV